MHLYDVPLVFALIGLGLYSVLAGADFGGGFWALTAGSGPAGERIRDHVHHSVAAVWEANHVWLIFVLTVVWTAYPVAFGSIASTLSIALIIAGFGIIVRGAAYALRSGTSSTAETRVVDTASGLSSVLAPFALGAAIGGIASRRVPVGNAAGNLITSWLNPVGILIGVLAVATCAYLAAVYLAADATRREEHDLTRRFRARALGAGLAAGAIALGGVAVLHADAHPLYHRLVAGDGLPALILSVLAGICALVLVWTGRFGAAQYTAAVAVAAIIAGWALAQQPVFLPHLTIAQAAAPHDTLVAITVAVLAGAAIVFPSLALLFRLTLAGRLGHTDDAASAPIPVAAVLSASTHGLLVRVAAACLLVSLAFLTAADARWAHVIGVSALLVFIVTGFLAATPAELAQTSASREHHAE
jgi:cytochrome bd ubiquinol oxidase subunit II